MRGVVLVWAALAMIATGCVSADVIEQSRTADDSRGGAGEVVDPDGGGGVGVEIDVDEDGAGFDLNFSIEARAPSVIVGAATGTTISAYPEPNASDSPVVELSNPNAVGGPLVFQLITREDELGEWVEVLLPIRPNGSTGWVRRSELELSENPFRIEIDIDQHRMQVLKANVPWMTTTVAIGTGDTPTPVGRFYVTELLRPPTDDGPYGPFAFGISGFSETLTNYAGGEGVIGIHGTNEPDSLGRDVSHGCVRVANHLIEDLASVLPLGTPVLIQT